MLTHCPQRGRASDILRKKKKNFVGFSRANSRKNWPILRDFRGKKVKIRGKKVKIRGTIGQVQAIFAGEKSKFAEKSAYFAGFSGKKSIFEGFSGANNFLRIS